MKASTMAKIACPESDRPSFQLPELKLSKIDLEAPFGVQKVKLTVVHEAQRKLEAELRKRVSPKVKITVSVLSTPSHDSIAAMFEYMGGYAQRAGYMDITRMTDRDIANLADCWAKEALADALAGLSMALGPTPQKMDA
jgi:hypothetical protein